MISVARSPVVARWLVVSLPGGEITGYCRVNCTSKILTLLPGKTADADAVCEEYKKVYQAVIN